MESENRAAEASATGRVSFGGLLGTRCNLAVSLTNDSRTP